MSKNNEYDNASQMKKSMHRMNLFFLSLLLSTPLIINESVRQQLEKLIEEQTTIEANVTAGVEQESDEIIQIPNYDYYDFYNNQIRRMINKSRAEKGIEGLLNEEPIFSSYLSDSTFYGDLSLNSDTVEFNFGDLLPSTTTYYNNDWLISVLNRFGTFSSIQSANVESLKLFFNNNEKKKVILLHINDISSGKEVKELISFLLRQQIQVTELEIYVNKDTVLDGKYIEFLSNMPGLRSLSIRNNTIVPIHAQNLGKKNGDLRSIEFKNTYGYESALSFDSEEIKDLKMRGIQTISYNADYINIDKKHEELQDVLDRYVRFLNSKYDLNNLNRVEKIEIIIELINKLYRYSKEVKAEKDESKKEELWLKYFEDGLLAPLIDISKYGIDETTGERNVICANYAALCVALCERIVGEGSAYYVSDKNSKHAYCLINKYDDGRFYILDPTFSDSRNRSYWPGIDDSHTENAISRYYEIIGETRRNYILDKKRESAKNIREELRDWLINKYKSYNNPNARQREELIDKLKVTTTAEKPKIRHKYDVIPGSSSREIGNDERNK